MISSRPNPAGYLGIAVTDLDRAMGLHAALFQVRVECTVIDGHPVALSPLEPGAPGAGGASARGDVYVPGKAGPVPRFPLPDIHVGMARAARVGATVLHEKKSMGENGFAAGIEDSEGNRIALHTHAR